MQLVRRKRRCRLLARCMAFMLMLVVMPAIPTKAASYSGSGTMADPYLVQTAQQLQGMRDNLSAHYKLANTIDLSGVDFKPIGRLDAPFKGSFVCEVNADKTPKFAIKNLSVSVEDKPYASEKKNKWEAALFGATDGATISGIYVLDAKISNQVQGDNQGAVQYGDYKPGMDEMNSAILIGEASGTTVVNCGVTGVINTKSNHCGGLIGFAESSTIENCYSTAEVTSKGKWNIGGFIGTAKNTMVTACFSTGNVTGAQSNIGAFIGGATNVTVTDCYATGNASGGKERKNAFIVQADGASATMTNCYALGNIDAAAEAKNNPITATNCWVLSGRLHNMIKFQEGSLAQIKSAFAQLPNWDTSGEQPKLTTMGIVTNAAEYQPQAVSQQPSSGTAGGNGTTAGENAGTDTSETVAAENRVTPEQVLALIEKLPNPEIEGAVTADDKDAIKEAWNAYESLSVDDKDAFDATQFAKLADCRYQVTLLIVADWMDAVDALPDPKDLTLDDIEKINELWDDYLFMDESILEASSRYEKLKEKLEAAHEFAEKNANVVQGTVVEVDNGLTTIEWIIVVVCLTLFVLIMIFELVVIIVVLRKNKKNKKDKKKEVVKDEGIA